MKRSFLGGLAIGIFFVGGVMPAFAETDEERKRRLEEELQTVERQILKQKVLVEDKQLERQSLERDLDILDAQIRKARLGIQARALAIETLDDEIEDKAAVVDELNSRLDKQRQSLGQLMRKTQEIDDFSLVEVVLSRENLSTFFEDVESFQSIKESLNKSLSILKEIRVDTQDQIESLEEKQIFEAEMKELQENEKDGIENKEAQKEEILQVTKGQEAAYQELLESQQRTAAELRNALFQLSGGGAAIPFPEAVRLAKFASARTGVDAALILAILEQESNYGSNLGTCSYDDVVHGKDVMHPERDQPPFLALANVLGFSARSQQISCPWIRSGERIGWGGAMGPSQFIPSTWAIYGGLVNTGNGWEYVKAQDKIRSATGKTSASNPFNNQDAFMATAMYMRDQGADGTYNGDWTAAIRYFSGWNGWKNPINHPYGDGVMGRKSRLEREIQILGG